MSHLPQVKLRRIHPYTRLLTLSPLSAATDRAAVGVTHAPKYIGLACVAIIALAMLLSIYYLVAKRGHAHAGASAASSAAMLRRAELVGRKGGGGEGAQFRVAKLAI